MVVYMMDEKGLWFESAADSSVVPFNVLLQPGQSVTMTQTFEVSGASGHLILVVEHEGFKQTADRILTISEADKAVCSSDWPIIARLF